MNALKKYSFIVFFGSLVISKKTSAQGGIDLRILEAVNPRYPTSQYWKYTSTSAYVFSGVATVAPLVYGLASGDDAAKHRSYEIITGIAVSTVVMEGLKISMNRTRPGDRYPDLIFPDN